MALDVTRRDAWKSASSDLIAVRGDATAESGGCVAACRLQRRACGDLRPLTPDAHAANTAPTDLASTDRIVVGETLFNLFVEFPWVGHLKLPAAARGIQITCGRVSPQRIVNLVATTVSWC